MTVFRDTVAKGTAYPLVVIQEDISTVAEPAANSFAGDHAVIELVQVDLRMQKSSPNSGTQTESYTLPDALHKVLNGARLPAAPSKVYGLKVVNRVRIPDMPTRDTDQKRNTAPQPSGVIRVVYTVQVKRNLMV